MRIILRTKKYHKGGREPSGYIKTTDFGRNCHIFVAYQNNPKVIRDLQRALLKHFDLIEEQRGKLNPSSQHRPHFSRFLDKKVKIWKFQIKKGKFELVKIGSLKRLK